MKSNYWHEMRDKFVQHMYDRDIESFFYLSTENARQMKTVYTRAGNIKDFLEYLNYMASMEELELGGGAVLTSIGGES